MRNLPYIVGIDLGTSNTAVAYAAPGKRTVELFAIEQLVAPGQVAARPLLPSARYHPAAGEISPAELQLPWPPAEGGDPPLIGRLALDLGAQVPGRLVASAKSWLSHAGVDRLAPILPWGADAAVAKVSPVDASAGYLAHVRAAWDHRFPEAPLAAQEVVLTVPASFDEGARALTLEAARQAGLPSLRLLEEPQAAVYDWLFRHRHKLARELAATRLLLVCDVGGGTTDLTLIQVALRDGEPELTRIGVGDHLMLGGDNMDLALAHLLESRLAGGEGRLGAARFAQLTARCRVAKEQLLAADAPAAVAVTLLGGGARLVGGAQTLELKREEVRQLMVDGFFPRIAADAPVQQRRGGLVEFGLPYPADPAITRHLAAFLQRHAQAARQALGDRGGPGLPVPDTLLVNGGVFRAHALAERLGRTLGDWRGRAPRVLSNPDPDVAVARGAVAYALARQGHGRRIGGGSARSYFLVLDEADQEQRGICILPRGCEEGHEIRLPERRFNLRLGQPVRFHLASSAADTDYPPGEIAALTDDFVRLPPLATVVQPQAGDPRREVRVQLTAAMTEVGTLELHCVGSDDPGRRWLLEFQLRGGEAVPAAVPPSRLGEAVRCLDQVFGERAQPADNPEPRQGVRRLRGQLEHLLGKREDWDMALLRALFDALLERGRRRRRSPEHERLWLNLAGFCLRPGFGDALDPWRIEQLCRLLAPGVAHDSESQNWSEWWILWRRVAGGLPAGVQESLLAELAPALEAAGAKPRSRLLAAIAGSRDDMLRLAASLERLPVERKVHLGEGLLAGLPGADGKGPGWWALSRLGARRPLYGSIHQVVPPEVAGRWLDALLAVDWKQVEPAAFAAAQIARRTGDRARDVDESLRQRILARLAAINAPAHWVEQVRTVVELDPADERRAFGESLPAGLRLVPEVRTEVPAAKAATARRAPAL